MELWQVLMWGILSVLLIGVEIATVQMVCIWFAAGSLAAFIVSLFGGSLILQLVIFILVSVALLILTRPIVKKSMKTPISHTNADSIIGQTGIVYEANSNALNIGRIRVEGLEYAAKTENGEPLKVDQNCKVIEIIGVTAIVKPL